MTTQQMDDGPSLSQFMTEMLGQATSIKAGITELQAQRLALLDCLDTICTLHEELCCTAIDARLNKAIAAGRALVEEYGP